MSIIGNASEEKKDTKTVLTAKKDNVRHNISKLPMYFIPNAGQIDSRVKYYTKGRNIGFYFTEEEVVLSFIKESSQKDTNNKDTMEKDLTENEENEQGIALAMHFIDAKPDVKIEGQMKDTGKVNYFKGNNSEKWFTDLSTYRKVVYKNLWKGIDLVFYGTNGQLKYEFIVYPGADYQDIVLSYEGSHDISLDHEGNLLIKNDWGVLVDKAPLSYQEIEGRKQLLHSSFVIKHGDNSVYCFEIGKGYNPNYPIRIDPGLIYSTYIGGNAADQGTGIAIDSSGNAYVTGITSSLDFPTTTGVFQPTFGGGFSDAFISKLNNEGTALIYSTYLGGSGAEFGSFIAVDSGRNAYVTGQTSSLDFPTTAGVFQPGFGGGPQDAFVTKLNATGTALIYSTYLGGNDFDAGSSILVDNANNVYVTGGTSSANFPVTAGVFQPVFGGSQDAFVTKINAMGTALIYSTYLGGSGSESGVDIKIDNGGNAYVTGLTTSADFPTTAGAFQTVFGGGTFDIFVTKINPTATGLVYSTYIGGNMSDRGFSIAIDTTGNAYVTGETDSLNFPTTPGAFQPAFSGGIVDAFVTKLNAAGSALIYSTYLGGSDTDIGNGIAVDSGGSAYVAGPTCSPNFPTTKGAFQRNLAGSNDLFITRLNAQGTGLIYSTYLGGTDSESGGRIAIDNKGNAYVTGRTFSSNFPVTEGAFQTMLAGQSDVFVSKIDTELIISPKIRVRNQNMTAMVYESDSN